jgi:hypothetical protein
MAKDILSEYGSGSSQPQRAPASNGGCCESKDVMNYSPPVGPKGINDPQTPGIHGPNSGVDGTQGGGSTSPSYRGFGGAGINNRGNSGSQGKY